MTTKSSKRPIPLVENLGSHPTLLNTRHGVFYPKGCDVFVFKTMEDMQAAWVAMQPGTIRLDDAVALSAEQI
ncbi:MAG: hypothetical protein KDD77_21605, partial [Caldilineaceae bacterium]|nr:hypothetical protein [Caldilineaceae bacterium]